MKTFLFVNPLSGHHSAERLQLVLEQLRAHAMTPKVFEVRTPAEIYVCCSGINKELVPPLVIVAGGDGTFNAVVNGLEPGKATLALLPFGTSNVLAAEIGITSLADAVVRIIAGKSSSLSVGIIELEGRSLRFLLMAGIGLDGAVVRDVWPLGKRFLRQGAYAISALKRTLLWDSRRFEISSPEGTVACHTAIICNASRYGGDFILSPDCSPFTSGLSSVCITGNSRSSYLNSALELFRNRAGTSKNMTRIHSSSFEIRGEHPIQIDGDFVGYGPARISECVDFARVIV
ncbi:MAG TPA: diacylglycerol kinase family lipid kinase [Desulfuromonadales bacterium]|nr:diacylglycerol kinase family lipid kinase [Desulfuromonadales bacterium]